MGRWVTEGEALLEIAEASSWQARLFVPASGIYRIHHGDSVRLTIDALSEILTEHLDGTIQQGGVRSAQGEGTGGTFLVLASVEPPADSTVVAALRSGFAVRGDVVTEPASLPALLLGWLRRKWPTAR